MNSEYIARYEGETIDISRIGEDEDTQKNGIMMAGLISLPRSQYPTFIWISGYLPRERVSNFQPHQICNKIPMMNTVCFKTTLFSSLNDF